jgi:hypothetical protein
LINDVPRCLIHSFTNTDLTKALPKSEQDDDYVFFRDYIPRYSTAAAVVIQGVMINESADLTTMWTILGFPLSSVIIPVWLLDNGTLPNILQADESGTAPLCDLALKLKGKVFSLQNDAKENYLNVGALINQENTGVRQKLIPIEKQVLSEANSKLNSWRKVGLNQDEVKQFYSWIDSEVLNKVKEQFNLE